MSVLPGSVSVHHVGVVPAGGQKRAWDPLKPELHKWLQAIMSYGCSRWNPGSSGRTTYALPSHLSNPSLAYLLISEILV